MHDLLNTPLCPSKEIIPCIINWTEHENRTWCRDKGENTFYFHGHVQTSVTVALFVVLIFAFFHPLVHWAKKEKISSLAVNLVVPGQRQFQPCVLNNLKALDMFGCQMPVLSLGASQQQANL